MYRPTQRSYTEKTTGQSFRMYQNDTTGENKLINEKSGKKAKSFLVSAFTGKKYRFEDNTEIALNAGEFICIDPKNKPTHEKFFFQKRFKKLTR